jgi:hypothetical protein
MKSKDIKHLRTIAWVKRIEQKVGKFNFGLK